VDGHALDAAEEKSLPQMRKSEAAASEDVVPGLIAAEAGSTTSNGKPGANRYVMLSRGCACRVARDGPAEAESTMTRWCREKSCRFKHRTICSYSSLLDTSIWPDGMAPLAE
jgi:hypothetical protein